jgi:hypothetical protein
LEFTELKRLEKKMKQVEREKIRLLKKEQRSEKSLLYTSGKRALEIEEVEALYELKARERERALTKLYGRLNSKIKEQILSNEGVSRSSVRKIKPFAKDKDKESRLFEGIRDQKMGVKWLKTPQPVLIKFHMVRCLKDKAPSGSYMIRASVLDRLIDNKMYYKFIDYGNKEKEKEAIKREEEAEEKLKESARLAEEKRQQMMHSTANDEVTHTVEEEHKIDQNVNSEEEKSFFTDPDDEPEESSPMKSAKSPSPFKSVGFSDSPDSPDKISPARINIHSEEDEKSPAKSFSEYQVPTLKHQ